MGFIFNKTYLYVGLGNKMATYEEQRKMAQRFFDRYLHGQFTVGISPRPEGVKYLGIDAWDATEYAQATYKCIFAENSNISERDFAREMLSRIPVLNNLASSFEQSLKRASGAKEGVAASYVAAFFNYTYDLGLSFRDQVRSFKLNARFIPAWLKSMPKKIGNFTVHYEIWKHPETPLTIEIRNQEGKRVATIGGLLYYVNKYACGNLKALVKGKLSKLDGFYNTQKNIFVNLAVYLSMLEYISDKRNAQKMLDEFYYEDR